MSDLQRVPAGFITPYREYSRHNTQTLSGVSSHLWQDFFARALADQVGDGAPPPGTLQPVVVDGPDEPAGGSELLAEIVSQRACEIVDTEIRPPEPLFLPIAEFEMELADKPAPAFAAEELVAQQAQQDFDREWRRPLVLTAGQPLPTPGPAPQPRSLFLPIAEFELDLLDPPAPPYPPQELVEQQQDLDYDLHWARPIVLQNLRIAA